MPPDVIDHKVLGAITDVWKGRVWRTAPLRIGVFGYVCAIEVETDCGAPSALQLDAMVRIATATPEFKAEVEGYMYTEYHKNVRPAYSAAIGNSNYHSILTEADLPAISDPKEIWKVIDGLSSVTVDPSSNLGLEFVPAFDPGHSFAVRFRDGRLYEIMIDG